MPEWNKSNHYFYLLEAPVDARFLPLGRWKKIEDIYDINHELADFDIVQIDFWNHPKIYNLLARISSWPKIRLIFYCHVNGLSASGYIPPLIVNLADHVVFSTQASMYSEAAKDPLNPLSIIPGFGGAEEFLSIRRQPHDRFTVLYVGSAHPTKFLVESINWAIEICGVNARVDFTFCTQDDNSYLAAQVPSILAKRFQFEIAVKDLRPFFATADVFGYPLNPDHYGTGEQVLLEAMAAGVPPLVMGNLPESFIVDHMKTGIVANDRNEYIEGINDLCSNRNLLSYLSLNARAEIAHRKNAKNTVHEFENFYEKCILLERRSHKQPAIPINAFELFCLSQGPDNEFFRNIVVNANPRNLGKLKQMGHHFIEGKGSILHWTKEFPESNELIKISKMIRSQICKG